ncbi:circularly permuted type 2 ATP-grasp protein [Pseudosulfitobacter koreensis]|uniref:Circularly permuted type 2 ATP-grasp protein n=1 Tax=Pseudosulfitobacter koreensis TaxID=2968472 RepID=A0ABT1Z2Y2_9RHOB|nr:circularly permuted type 2 ATP-grasp protein [Pseudosulfitobacter koreense]MCR8827501.1 circularly permuted type 2 ATP-grasp protein [Pseudosulfitobacter koreense]
MASTQTNRGGASNDLLANYATHRGVRDEMIGADGAVKPAWRDLMKHLGELSTEGLAHRFARGDQYLSEAGVFYRQYDDTVSSEREWPLSHIPVVLGESEWAEIGAGLVQRADLLEYVVRDFYGANDLVRSGQIPAALLGQNPAWLRPMMGVQPKSEPFLNFLSFEIGRGPDGRWWVISDIVESPTTTGFAIENRVALSRVFPNFFSNAHVHRIAGFFQAIQQRLFDLRGKGAGQIAMLSPGPMNQNYAEHAYLARYLGLLLVEGEDLIVTDGQAMVRTVSGPKPISLLWNRVPSAMIDPLELEAASLIGTPGLLDALRRRNLRMLNAEGAGVLETRALMAFLPKIARKHLGQPLIMPNIATWWCGHAAERDHVIRHCEQMMVGSAFSTVPLMADPGTFVFDADKLGSFPDHVMSLLQTSGRELVGQETVTLSTTPVYENEQLVARPMCLRVFLVRTADGWQMMPGGYARVSGGDDPKALAMQRGGKVADVWIVSDTPVPQTSLLTPKADAPTRAFSEGALPSRSADNLFWVGRNVERAEFNVRLFRAYFARVSDGVSPGAPILRYIRKHLLFGVTHDAATMAERFETPLYGALQAATKIGDRFSPDGMKALKDIVQNVDRLHGIKVEPDDILTESSLLLRKITGFSGLVHENMYRSHGWRFLSLGISLERAAGMVRVLRQLGRADAPEGALNLALELGDSIVSHRARFSVVADIGSVFHMLALDANNPRSVRFHVTRANQQIKELPGQTGGAVLGDVARRILLLETQLATVTTDGLTTELFDRIERELWALSDALTETFLV